jgi:hypothetical protein
MSRSIPRFDATAARRLPLGRLHVTNGGFSAMHQINGPTIVEVNAARILDDLTSRQHLHPHARSEDALMESAAALGFCPRAAEHAMRWLDIDPGRSIGRLRRTELTQLSHSVYRFWRHALALEPRQSA